MGKLKFVDFRVIAYAYLVYMKPVVLILQMLLIIGLSLRNFYFNKVVLSACLSAHLSFCLPIHPSAHTSFYLPVRQSVCPSVSLSARQSFCPICLSLCLPVHPSACLFVCLSFCLPVRLSACLFVCLSDCPAFLNNKEEEEEEKNVSNFCKDNKMKAQWHVHLE
jgi:hypothetical protein